MPTATPVIPARQVRTESLTMVDMSEAEIEMAEEIAKRLNYTQTAYTSESSLFGLFCLRDGDKDKKPAVCIVKTKELGYMVVSTLEDIGMFDLYEQQFKK